MFLHAFVVAQIQFKSDEYFVNEADRIVNLTVVLLTAFPLGRDTSFR